MTTPMKRFALLLGFWGLALNTSTSLAQVGPLSKLAARHSAPAMQARRNQAQTPGSTPYTYTLLNYPGTLFTYAGGINKGVTTTKMEIVGGEGSGTQGGFLVTVSGKGTVTEAYRAVNFPHEPLAQNAYDVNDSGQIVGQYLDGAGIYHGYERSLSTFSKIDVPFTGATGTGAAGINNVGEVVGGWFGSDGTEHGFTLIGGSYASFDYPGSTQSWGSGVNSAGQIVGTYIDASGAYHGYLLSGGTYTSIDPSGSVQTFANGINDSGDIVGWYCTTSACVSTGEGEQGFLLSGGVFTTITIPGEFAVVLTDINNNGVVVGSYQDGAGLNVSFMATP